MRKLSFFVFLFCNFLNAQVTVPYVLDLTSDTDEGWTTGAISGTNDWMRGIPEGQSLPVWKTNLNDYAFQQSNRYLESPSFNLENIDENFALSFTNNRHSNSSGQFLFEYSTDGGQTWQLLNPDTPKKSHWQTSTGFSLNPGTFRKSSVNIAMLQGFSDVRFRFRYQNTTGTFFGWIIRDFEIQSDLINLTAVNGIPDFVTPLCPNVRVRSTMLINNPYSLPLTFTNQYYFSYDDIWDDDDILLFQYQNSTSSSVPLNVNRTLSLPENLSPGTYYLIHVHDALNVIEESNEDDNWAVTPVIVRPNFNLPYFDDFENENLEWNVVKGNHQDAPLVWERSEGRRHHLVGTHSGNHAWHTSNTVLSHPDNAFQYVETPYFDISSLPGDKILSFWYKCDYRSQINYYGNLYKVEYVTNCLTTWNLLGAIGQNPYGDWTLFSIDLPSSIDEETYVKFRITYQGNYLKPEGIIFDDLYIGLKKTDLVIKSGLGNLRTTNANQSTDVLHYQMESVELENQNFTTRFYWSNDEFLDAGDVLLGEKTNYNWDCFDLDFCYLETEQSFTFNKPTLAEGQYFIIYQIDVHNEIEEFNEINNQGVIPIYQLPTLSLPYENDFEEQITYWQHLSTLNADDWEWSTPQGTILNQAFSGQKAWITQASGPMSEMSRMHLYSPVFDLSNVTSPVLSFDMKLDTYSHGNIASNMSYSIDNGATWVVLVPQNTSFTRWYQRMHYVDETGIDIFQNNGTIEKMFQYTEPFFSTHLTYNSRDFENETHYAIDVSHLAGNANVRFRFNITSTFLNNFPTSYYSYNYEGMVIDNFAIKEGTFDLLVQDSKTLYWSSLAEEIKFSVSIYNDGDLESESTQAKFYLSNDTVLNDESIEIGSMEIPSIRPYFRYYKNLKFNLPTDFDSFSYLIYELDPENLTNDQNHLNNTGYFSLGLSGITEFPYVEKFEDDFIDGWHGYSYTSLTSNEIANYRVIHKISKRQYSNLNKFATKRYDGILATENVAYGFWQNYLTPLYYIYSPTFDFTAYQDEEPLTLIFDVMSIGQSFQTGGNLDYSVDGGLTWNLIEYNFGESHNWYQVSQNMQNFGNQPGWFWTSGILKTVKMNISALQGFSNVIFRFKYFSNFASSQTTARGFRIDNFAIGAESLINSYLCTASLPYTTNFSNPEDVCWQNGNDPQELILTERNPNPEMTWDLVNNFAAEDGNNSYRIIISGTGNTDGAWLLSPKFFLSEATSLSFRIALTDLVSNAPTQLDTDDMISLRYTIDNGFSWVTLMTWSQSQAIASAGQMVEINSNLPMYEYVQFAFVVTNGNVSNNDSIFYVDDFSVNLENLSVTGFGDLEISFYPNPVDDQLHITAPIEIESVKVFAINGQMIFEKHPFEKQTILDFNGLSSGMYFIMINSQDKAKTVKILKK